MLQFPMLPSQNKFCLEGFINTFHTVRYVGAFKNITDLLKSTLAFLLSLCYKILSGFAFTALFNLNVLE